MDGNIVTGSGYGTKLCGQRGIFTGGNSNPIIQLAFQLLILDDITQCIKSGRPAIEVVRVGNQETTALGAAYLAGIAAGWWTIGELAEKWRADRSFHSAMAPSQIEGLKQQWQKAVARTKNWAE